MPPRRPSAPQPESKTGLVVALVFFILMTIVLGVVAYKGFDGQKDLEQKASTAAADAKKALDAERASNARLTASRIMMGTFTPPADVGELNSNPAFREELDKIQKDFETIKVSWDPKAQTPPVSILVQMKQLQTERDTERNNAATAYAARDKAIEDYKNAEATQVAKVTQAQAEQAKLAKTASDAQKGEQEAKSTGIGEITKLGALLKEEKTKAEKDIGEFRTREKRLQDSLAGQKQTIEKFKADSDITRQKVIMLDVKHGFVTKVDAANDTAFVDLGSADFVRPGMAFTVLQNFDASKYGPEEGLPKKATLAIVQVLGPKLSRATIKYEPTVSASKDPVRNGDALYKPGWKPGTPVRWALAGHFDLSGLGRDETKSLVTQLKKQGIVVDAYLDLATLKVEGEMNYGIDYLIVGTRPTGETARIVGPERKEAIEKAINDMVDKAREMGITVMQHRVFLPIAGIDLPREQAFPYFPGGSGGTTGEKPADDKKDEGK